MVATEPRPATFGDITENRISAAARRTPPSWAAVATMMLSVMLPVSGWMISLSSRVAVLENDVRHMATSEQVAMQTQKLEDFEQEYRRDQINASVVAARNTK